MRLLGWCCPPSHHRTILLLSLTQVILCGLLNCEIIGHPCQMILLDQQASYLLHSMYFMCARLKRLLPPNIWFRGLEKLDEMSGLRFLAQPSCLHPRFYASKGKTCRGSPYKDLVNTHPEDFPDQSRLLQSQFLPFVYFSFKSKTHIFHDHKANNALL